MASPQTDLRFLLSQHRREKPVPFSLAQAFRDLERVPIGPQESLHLQNEHGQFFLLFLFLAHSGSSLPDSPELSPKLNSWSEVSRMLASLIVDTILLIMQQTIAEDIPLAASQLRSY